MAAKEILRTPERYPSLWLAAERWHSAAHQEPVLEQVVLNEKWIPKVPPAVKAPTRKTAFSCHCTKNSAP